MGPSLFTMPNLIEDIFEIANKPIENYFTYKRKSVICNYFYEDGTKFSAPADICEFAKSASNTFDVEEKLFSIIFTIVKKIQPNIFIIFGKFSSQDIDLSLKRYF
ncbi:MAG: hypothetical protein CM15mP23_02900 [Cryomorphaceae bacterium]|nr:MAG: hypothetical protein CM15mP23_02900 [Cryomorphaceae bacterium]